MLSRGGILCMCVCVCVFERGARKQSPFSPVESREVVVGVLRAACHRKFAPDPDCRPGLGETRREAKRSVNPQPTCGKPVQGSSSFAAELPSRPPRPLSSVKVVLAVDWLTSLHPSSISSLCPRNKYASHSASSSLFDSVCALLLTPDFKATLF